MFRRKQDVDKHVNSILLRRRGERERNSLGYQIARLYADIREFSIARRYLSGFLSVRENVPAAYQLMGEINEGLDQKEVAIDNYKRALDLGGFVSSNKFLVQKICKLYTEIGTDTQRMEYWLEQLEKLDPKSDMIFQLKAQIAEIASGNGDDKVEEMENIISSELVKRPTDLKLRIKLLKLYLDTGRVDEAYEVAVTCDLTTAFVDALPWFECMCAVFKKYGENKPDSKTDSTYNQHYMHVLRNLAYLSLPVKNVSECADALSRFDRQLKHVVDMGSPSEAWAAMLKEMKGQMFFLASLVLLKRAQTGAISWKDVNHLSGACLLASKSMDPIDAQAPWFVSAPATHKKFYDWWQRQSYDRLSQVGHMLGQLSRKKRWEDVTEWGFSVRRDTMTSTGHQRVFEQLYCPGNARAQGAASFLFQAREMVAGMAREKEPFTEQHLLDIDRVAYEVHLGNLNHLVWLCLQRYSLDMNAQPNYYFTLMENIQLNAKNLENTASETLSQLDILVFLLASVRCAANAIYENNLRYADSSGRPSMLPVSLAKPLCSPDQEEWWTTAYRFCTNTIKDDYSRLRRVLVRGLETVRLVGAHGVSVQMMLHIARSLDAKVKSYRSGQHGCRCPAYDLSQLENRAAFYWEKARQGLEKALRNQHVPVPKKRLFKEAGDMDTSPMAMKLQLDEASFALSVHFMKTDKLEEAIRGFEKLNTPYAKFYSAKIYKTLSDQEAARNDDSEESITKKIALASKARDCLYDTIDRLEGDKSHELNVPVYKELDELDVMLHDLEIDERNASPGHSFHTPLKSPSEMHLGTPGLVMAEGFSSVGHSTPRPTSSTTSHITNGASRHSRSQAEPNGLDEEQEISSSNGHQDVTQARPRPSPERLDAQLKFVSYSQSSMFKMVLERNDELIMINSKLMEELRDNNSQLKTVLTENQGLMSDLKSFLGENRDMMKQIKNELGDLKAGLAQQAAAQPPPPMAPTQPVYFPPHMAGIPPRGPAYPNFPPPAYPSGPGYMINSPMPGAVPPRPPVGPQYRPSGLPGSHSSNVGKYRSPSDEDDEEVDPEDLTSAEEAAALYADYCDDSAYAQFFTPDTQIIQDWSSRSAMEGPPPPINMAPPPPRPPCMSIPSPGYFASALRGQALQYAQNTPPPAQVRPPPLGPGFFSSPLANSAAPATATSTPSLLAALTGQATASPNAGFGMPASSEAAKIETTASPTPTSINLGPTLSGLKSLFQSKGVLEPSKAKGDITILVDTNSRRATILMMGETKDIIFHHDIQGLMLEKPPYLTTASTVSWTANKIGAAGDRERVTLGLDSPAVATQLKEAIQRATALIQPKSITQGVAGAPSKIVGGPSATSTPLTGVANTASTTGVTASTPSTAADASKPTFGGFTFSQAPVVAPVTTAEKPKPEASLPATSKADTAKPFANFTLTPSAQETSTSPSAKSPVGAAQKSPKPTQSGVVPKSPGGAGVGEEDHVEEYEPNVDFKPVIALPELVEKTTGEENETALFVERCRLYRFDSEDTKQWKERGVGELKILSSNDQLKFRIIMRREQIFKLCANHCLSADMKLTPMQSSDRAWCYTAMDFSEQEMKLEQLAAKFKSAEKATAFKDIFTSCCQQLKAVESKGPAADAKEKSLSREDKTATKDIKSSGKEEKPSEKESTAKPLSLSEMFKPKAGSWECDGCMIRNNAEVNQCPACGTMKPGVKAVPAAPSGSSFSFGAKPAGGTGFSFGAQGTGFTFGAPAASSATSTPPQAGTGFTFGAPATTSASTVAPKTGTGFTFGAPTAASSSAAPQAGSGFTFGAQAVTSSSATAAPQAGTGFTFGAPATTSSAATTPANTGFRFGAPVATSASTTPGTGFTFGAPAASASPESSGSGFKFNLPATSSATTTTPSGGFKFDTSAAAGSTTSSEKGAAATGSGGFSFKPASVLATSAGAETTTASPASTSGFSFKLPASSSASTAASFGSGTAKPAVFSFATSTSTSTSTATSESKPTNALASVPCGLLAKLLTADVAEEPVTQPKPAAEAPKPSGGFNFSMTPKTSTTTSAPSQASAASTTSSSQGFQFSFTKSPGKPSGSPAKPVVPGSPEVDEHGLYITKEGDDAHIHFEPVVALPEIVEVKTGEEDEVVLFESRGKMYRFVSGEWKEKGLGVVKILEHKDTKKTRVLMRREQILKVCCNHFIDANIILQPMAKSEGKAWVWYALDFTEEEGKMEQLALRFKTVEIANQFKSVVDKCRESNQASPPKNVSQDRSYAAAVKKELFKADSSTDKASLESEDDVIFVREEKPTAEEIAQARKYKLPDNFYLYKYKPPCPGCIGCTDGEYGPGMFAQSPQSSKGQAHPVQSPVVSSGTSKLGSPVSAQGSAEKPSSSQRLFGSSAASSSQQVFGLVASNLPDFSKLTPDSKPEPSSSSSSSSVPQETPGFVFGSKSTVDFSSLAASGGSGEFTWKKADTSGPFSFAGAGQKLFGGSGGDHEDGGDDSVVAPSDDIHFEPIIPLPDLVESKTGEEDWKSLFSHRSKLYIFDKKLSQWKERGVGEMKILQHNSKVMFRVLQRREQVLKVACNHLVSPDMVLKAMSTSETAWCWTANDFTENDPRIEQFAIKFKTKEMAQEFKTVFEKCQETLRLSGGQTSGQDKLPGPSVAIESRQAVALGNKENELYTEATDVAADDFIVPSTFKVLEETNTPRLNFGVTGPVFEASSHVSVTHFQQTEPLNVAGADTMTPAVYSKQGDKGNPYMTKALDVASADTMTSTTYQKQGETLQSAGADTMTSAIYAKQGDKGNPYMTKALDVAGADTMTSTTYHQQGESLNVVVPDTMTPAVYSKQGDKGNPYMTKALDVAGADTMTSTTYQQQGETLQSAGADTMTSAIYAKQGDKGNPYMTKALDVAGADTMTSTTYQQQGETLQSAGADTMTSAIYAKQGDRGNPYMTKALDVAGADTMTSTTYHQQGESLNVAVPDTMTPAVYSKQGDKGNPYMTKALDVAGADTMTSTTYQQQGETLQSAGADTMTSAIYAKQGDKGNPYMTKALDVAGADTMTSTTYQQQGETLQSAGADTMTSAIYAKQGDRGNPYMTKALDVAGADTMTSTTYHQQGESLNVAVPDTMTPAVYSKKGDKGNPYMTKALDVAGADTMTSTTYQQQGETLQGARTDTMTSDIYAKQGDRGNPYMTKALDVAGADTMTSTTYHQQGETLQAAGPDTMKSAMYSKQGDKGNPYMTKALDVAGADTMTSTTYHQQGESLNVAGPDTMTPAVYSKQGDKGNPYMTKALDVAGADTMTSTTYQKQGETLQSASADTMTSAIYAKQGDKGNPYMTKALDVAGADTMTSTTYHQQGESLNVAGPDTMTPAVYSKQGDKGNPYMTKALDVAGIDSMTSTTYQQQGETLQGAGTDTMTSDIYAKQGDRGNPYMTKALDVAGADTMTSTTYHQQGETLQAAGPDTMKSAMYSKQGDKGNPYMTKALDVAGADTMTSTTYHQQGESLNVAGPDTMTPAVYSKQGDKGNPYMTKALDVASADTMTSTTYQQQGETLQSAGAYTMTSAIYAKQGDRGNPYMTKALDVAGADTMTSTTYHQQGESLNVAVPDTMTPAVYSKQGDKGNPYMTKALDVASADTMTSTTYHQQGETLQSAGADTMTSAIYAKQGDRGNPYMSKALDVAGADIMTATTYHQQGETLQGAVADTMTSAIYAKQGDKGNPFMTKALDVAGADTMTSTTYHQQGETLQAAGPDTMKSAMYSKQGDKGNPYMTKALDVAGADTMTSTTYHQQGESLNVAGSDTMTPAVYSKQGDKGNPYMTKALDVAGADTMTSTTYHQQGKTLQGAGADTMTSALYSKQGDRGNPYMSKALDVADADTMISTTYQQQGETLQGDDADTMTPAIYAKQGDKGNPYMTKALYVAGADTMTSTTYQQQGETLQGADADTMTPAVYSKQGDKGNPYMTKALDVAGADTMTSTTYHQQGETLQSAVADTMTSAIYAKQGDKGNPYMSKALDVAGADTMTSGIYLPQGDKENPYTSQVLDSLKKTLTVEGAHSIKPSQSFMTTAQENICGAEGRPNAQEQVAVSHEAAEQRTEEQQEDVEGDEEEEDYDEDEDDDDDDEDEEEEVLFEKRATLSSFENGSWKSLGTGALLVTYNEDINGNSILFKSDSGDTLCTHVITRELSVACNAKQRFCEWTPIDYATDEPVRRHFAASFSSAPAVNEFKDIFEKGRKLAMESELSENLPSEIDVPEVFSTGEPGH